LWVLINELFDLIEFILSGLFFTGEGCGILVESGGLAEHQGFKMGLCGFVN